jgi:hypothetical protein
MSIVINVEQSPLTITPTNAEHIWNVSSSAYTLTNFKYIIDVYFRPDSVDYSNNPQPTARLKVRPNSYGNAMFDLVEIVRTFLKANPRMSGTTYPYLNYVAQENSIITLADATETRTYNAFNLWPSGDINPDLPTLWHIEQYQCILGCEYSSGSTVVYDINPLAEWQPAPINIFPGVDNSLIPEPFLSGATLGSGYTQSPNFFQVNNQSWYYYDLFRHIYQQGEETTCGPREFLNAAGRIYKIISQPDITSTMVRSRMHHPDCPIITSFLDGQNDYFNNQNNALVIRSADFADSNYTYSAYTQNDSTLYNVWDIFKMGVFYLPYNSTASGVNVIPASSEKVCFYLTPTTEDIAFSARTSEILEFMMQPYDCINTPIHLLFLNSRGQWDTYTFGKKSVKNFEVERKSYRQEASLNKQFYSRGSYERGTAIYDQLGDYKITCQSWFMDENDVAIVEEIFFSPEVYIIKGTSISPRCIHDVENCPSCLNEIRLYEHLIPVVIEEKQLLKFNKKYQKIFQYTFTLNYSSVKRYRTQG